MKHTKKLIPALGMLLLSACMLVTSTFAWFSMNENVTANGMEVMAKGDQIFLQIINKDDTFKSGTKQITAQATDSWATAADNILPTNVKTATTVDQTTTYDDYKGTGDFVWVRATGTDVNDYRPDGNYTTVSGTDYYLENTFFIRLDPTAGAAEANGKLKVSDVKITTTGGTATDFSECLSVLVVCTIGSTKLGTLYNYDENGTWGYDDTTSATLSANNFNVKDDTGAQIDIYVFFNGDHPKCDLAKFESAKALKYAVEVNFTVK